jgi:diguanylate cyclase (GGDEF)-like protein
MTIAALTASLRTRVLLLTLAVFVSVSVPTYFAFDWIVRSTIITLGTLFAEKQVLFDRYRGLEALMKEVSLAEMLTRSPAIRAWASDEASPDKAERGLAELEQVRLSFKDQSYFVVINDSGNYYFNNKDNQYAGAQRRYTLDRNNPRDGWYYKTSAAGAGCQLNVDRDDNLVVTKVWINCPIMDGARVLGVIGTGVDLSEFIHEVVAIPQTGVQSMFVDRSGAIQAHRDANMVDWHSLTKDTKAKKTFFLQLDRDADRTTLTDVMARLAGGESKVESHFMQVNGHNMLVGVGFLDRLGWYNITLMDVDQIIDRRLFLPIAALLAAVMAAAVTLLTLLFKRSVLDRLARLDVSVRRVRGGDFAAPAVDHRNDEIGRLSRNFADMAAAIGDHTQLLETMVHERTQQLRNLAHNDSLTGIHNRLGFATAFERARNESPARALGLLLIDMDLFKQVNDSFGHRSGDRVLAKSAQRIARALHADDVFARWGGDEFIVLLVGCDETRLARCAKKTLNAIRRPIKLDDGNEVRVSVSLGACHIAAHETLDAAVALADSALYEAKRGGRSRFVIAGAASRSTAQPGGRAATAS